MPNRVLTFALSLAGSSPSASARSRVRELQLQPLLSCLKTSAILGARSNWLWRGEGTTSTSADISEPENLLTLFSASKAA